MRWDMFMFDSDGQSRFVWFCLIHGANFSGYYKLEMVNGQLINVFSQTDFYFILYFTV